LPNIATGPEVILPMSQMKWLLEQPDNVLNQNEVNRQFLHADRTMLHPNIIRDMVHGRVIRREMTKDLDAYCHEIIEEIEHSLTRNWGTGSDWKEVRVYDTMLDVIARISNRVLVGLPLCRDEEYLRSASTFARNVVLTAGLLNLLPSVLRPLLSPAIMAFDMYHYRKIVKHLFPIIKERMVDFQPGMDYRKPDYSKHNDYIQWSLLDAFSNEDPAERTPEMITKRLAVLSFAAIQSSVITITNIVFDIASSPHATDLQAALREEVSTVTAERGDQSWTRAGLALMPKIDSALRESMRLWGFISRGVMKKVIAPKGVTLPDGHHIPYGSKIGVTSYAVHHDESVYKDAYTFDAFRFCGVSQEEGLYTTADTGVRQANMVTSSDQFMAFSHGRHAWYVLIKLYYHIC
jgi:cytochrome P450